MHVCRKLLVMPLGVCKIIITFNKQGRAFVNLVIRVHVLPEFVGRLTLKQIGYSHDGLRCFSTVACGITIFTAILCLTAQTENRFWLCSETGAVNSTPHSSLSLDSPGTTETIV